MPYGKSENIKDTFFSLWPATEETQMFGLIREQTVFASDLATVSKVKQTQKKQCDLDKRLDQYQKEFYRQKSQHFSIFKKKNLNP